ncbi:Nramp family divalent metal transporter [Planosporangium thailandense]|uniref:Nramp family divalent metal transporter n=1 Tax=Planosporangium thailandense TaxID=765197 RepID=UPI00197C74CF|nr:Nramp family divalent metal transporter [Planosporangium thailandense]
MTTAELATVVGSPRRPSYRTGLAALGPAFVAAVAYVDPGNFATNFSGGAAYGYRLAWVVAAASMIGVLIQWLSAKLGLATGRSLPELCRERFPRPVTLGLWLQAEAVAMATDLAEVLGGAVALRLLFGLPLPVGAGVTAMVAVAVTMAHTRRARRFEAVVAALLLVVLTGFAYIVIAAPPDPAGLAAGMVPDLPEPRSVVFAVGILGATVMPHAIFAHSALTGGGRYLAGGARDTDPAHRRRLLRWLRIDLAVAMGVACLLNVCMLALGAVVFAGGGARTAASLEDVHGGLDTAVGAGAAVAFALALLASGFASSGVGTYAGQVIMDGFLRRRVPLALRRVATLAPALVVTALGVEPTLALVVSQVVLSFGIPFAVVPLILLTSRRAVMGHLVNRRLTTVVGAASAALVGTLNAYLLATLIA